ncbi:MAG: 50S ribosomal protein L24 [Chloroflexi bacterium]|nr:50S ribosomal protein L24 [Chloroflexota bacterium]
MAQKIRRGDTVVVTKGKDRGKQSIVQRVFPSEGKLYVEGLNMVKRHRRAQPGISQAGIITMEAPLALSNVKVVCPLCNTAARMGFTFLNDGKKVRLCKKCNQPIE